MDEATLRDSLDSMDLLRKSLIDRNLELTSTLERICRVASGQDQVADDDTEALDWILREAATALNGTESND